MHLWLAFFRGLFVLFPPPVERPNLPGSDLPGIEADREAIESDWRAVRRDLCKAINRELARKERE